MAFLLSASKKVLTRQGFPHLCKAYWTGSSEFFVGCMCIPSYRAFFAYTDSGEICRLHGKRRMVILSIGGKKLAVSRKILERNCLHILFKMIPE